MQPSELSAEERASKADLVTPVAGSTCGIPSGGNPVFG